MAELTMVDRMPAQYRPGPVFQIDAIARLFCEDEEGMKAPPCVRPPFPYTWFLSSWLSSKAPGVGVAVSVFEFQPKPGSHLASDICKMFRLDEAPRCLHFQSIVERSPGVFEAPVSKLAPIDSNYRLIEVPGVRFAGIIPPGRPPKPFPTEVEARAHYNASTSYYPISYWGLMGPAILALGLLNCRNVRKREHDPRPKLSQRCERVYGRPAVKFYTLEIDPSQPLPERTASVEARGDGAELALHICRGHFKTFDGKGLFGRYKGTYWWPAHVRGSAHRGVVLKDYSVAAPTPNGEDRNA